MRIVHVIMSTFLSGTFPANLRCPQSYHMWFQPLNAHQPGGCSPVCDETVLIWGMHFKQPGCKPAGGRKDQNDPCDRHHGLPPATAGQLNISDQMWLWETKEALHLTQQGDRDCFRIIKPQTNYLLEKIQGEEGARKKSGQPSLIPISAVCVTVIRVYARCFFISYSIDLAFYTKTICALENPVMCWFALLSVACSLLLICFVPHLLLMIPVDAKNTVQIFSEQQGALSSSKFASGS